jgi:allantoate deiminase
MRLVHRDLGQWMRGAGLQVRVDAVGNLVGRRASSMSNQVLLLGSHLDSVPGAGRFDGVLGVLIALAVVEQLGNQPLPFAVDVIGFSEEEGVRFATAYLGSQAVAGGFDSEWLERVDEAGVTMRAAIEQFGLNPAEIPAAAYPPSDVIGYLETHLEQGTVLEREGHAVAVVDAIVGQSRLRLVFRGVAAHAGTTPMDQRRDALVGAAQLVHDVRELGRATRDLRATVGCLRVAPNASNVIPSSAELSLDVRHADDARRLAAVDALCERGRQIADKEGLQFEIVEHMSQSATPMNARLSQLLADSVRSAGLAVRHLPSGAGHDAAPLAQRFPVSLLFVRHPGGVSHHPDEAVEADDVEVAIDVVQRFVLKLAQEHEHG